MQTTKPILSIMGEELPEYSFLRELRPALIFGRKRTDGLHEFLMIGRDNPGRGLSVELAITYNPFWNGETSRPLGRDSNLAELQAGRRSLQVEAYWTHYGDSRASLEETFRTMLGVFRILGRPFFEAMAAELAADKLVQAALERSHAFTPEQLAGINEALDAVASRVDRLKHPAFLELRDYLRLLWTADVPKDERRYTSRICYDILAMRYRGQQQHPTDG